jgi:hypothetical protein
MMKTEKAAISRKEKRLLIVAVVLGLFYLAFQFGFLPLFNEYREKTELLRQLEEEWALIEMRLNGEALVRATYERAKEAYENVLTQFERTGADTSLSRMLTVLSQDSGFEKLSQTLAEPTALVIPGAGGGEPSRSVFSTVTATMSFQGNYEQITSLVDAVGANSDVSINRLSFNSMDASTVSVTFVAVLLNSSE